MQLTRPFLQPLLARDLTDSEQALLLRSMAELKPRAKNLKELAESSAFLFRTRPIAMDERARKLLEPAAIELLAQARSALAAGPQWTAPLLEAAVRALSETAGVGLGKIAQPLRAALTGSNTSPGIFDVLEVLGREESLGRIDDQLCG